MSYRIDYGPLPPKPQRSMQTAVTPGRFYLTNGDSGRHFAIPCTYIVIKPAQRIENKKMLEAYKNEPSKHSIQIRKLHDSREERPIHFNKEYYKLIKDDEGKVIDKEYYKWDIECILEKDENGNPVLPGVEMSGYIDEMQDWIVRLDVNAICPLAEHERKSCKYTIVMYNEELGIRKVITTGTLIVLPAVINR